ncbi:hypothetical protein ACEPAI_1029 [Sanghuangporus weigelae]
MQSPRLLHTRGKPWGLKWRSSVWFITLIVGYGDRKSLSYRRSIRLTTLMNKLGLLTDLMVYSVIIPVVPFQLEKLGYGSPSALTGWLLFAYSIALVIVSPICSWFSEKYQMRRSPMLWGLLSLTGSLVMFMEAPNYPVMIIARILQGISSCVVWVIGLALLADTVPEDKIGLQLGLAMTGLTVGMLAAPPVGGALYDRFGFRSPFIFGIIVTGFDFLGRLLVVERKDALRWGYDPAVPLETIRTEGNPSFKLSTVLQGSTSHIATRADDAYPQVSEASVPRETTHESNEQKGDDAIRAPGPSVAYRLPEYQVWKFMFTSRRTIVALSSILIYGIVYAGLEPTLALRLQDLYNFNSTKVGLVILASAIAAVFASPISGWISDRSGVEWIIVVCLALAVPWYALMVIRGHLAFFIACFALANFMMSAVVPPLTSELSSIVRNKNGVGFGHIYGFFNVMYGAGSAVGPIAAGQIYSHVKGGWTVMLIYGSMMFALCSLANFFYGGERPLVSRIRRSNTHTTTV